MEVPIIIATWTPAFLTTSKWMPTGSFCVPPPSSFFFLESPFLVLILKSVFLAFLKWWLIFCIEDCRARRGWRYLPAMPASGKLRQEDGKSESNIGYTVRLFRKQRNLELWWHNRLSFRTLLPLICSKFYRQTLSVSPPVSRVCVIGALLCWGGTSIWSAQALAPPLGSPCQRALVQILFLFAFFSF